MKCGGLKARCLFALFALCWTLNTAAWSPAQDDVPDFVAIPDSISREERLRAGSLYEAFFANYQGMETGDVLIRQLDDLGSTIIADAENGEGKLTKSDQELTFAQAVFYRFRFDRTKGRYLFVRASSKDAFLITENGIREIGGSQDELKFGAFTVELGGKCFTKLGSFPSGEAAGFSDSKGLEQLFRDFKVPSLNAAGIVTFGSALTLTQIESAVARCASGDTISRIEPEGVSGRIKICWDEKMPGGRVPARSTVVFDQTRIVPDSRSIYLQAPSGQWVFVSKEDYSWNELSGMYIPASINRKYQGQKEIDGKSWIGNGNLRFDFHWFSVNENMEESDFDPALIADETTCIRLADPLASKAETLLPKRVPDSQEKDN